MININSICKKIYKKIKKYDTIVIARHIGPDPDAVASEISLRDSIKLTFPNKNVKAVGLGVSRFKYFGHLDRLSDDEIDNALLIMLDLPNSNRIDGANSSLFKEIIKIDHHPFEVKYGEVEWIDETASSTCQMIIELILTTKLKINDSIAANLFLGVVSDSERFLLPITTAKTFGLIKELLDSSNLNIQSLYSNLYERPLAEMRFRGYISENLIVNESGFAYLKIDNETITKYGVDLSSPSNLINSFNYIKEIDVWAFVVYDQKNELHKINIRSKEIPINEIATKYNGGGHRLASGCRIKDGSDVDKLLEELDAWCGEYKKHENS